MGEVASLVLDGILCQVCGTFISNEIVDYPRSCEDCSEDNEEDLV